MCDDNIHITIGLRLGAPLCQPHGYEHCGDAVGHLDSLSCERSQGRYPQHATINDIIHRSLVSAKITSCLEPSSLMRFDGKRPDGMIIVPWLRGKLLVWETNCSDILHLQT